MAAPGLRDVASLADFEEAVKAAPTAVAHFWAPWCEPCALLDRVLAALAADAPAAVALRVEAEEAADVSEAHAISVVPTFLFFAGGRLVDRLEGAEPAELSAKFARLVVGRASTAAGAAGAAAGPAAAPAAAAAALRARLEALTRQAPVVLFMKGSPEAPQCGFSAKVVAALRAAGASNFAHFDILTDDAVRQGMKEFSQWPTFPQLYAGGELLGGCDIVLELAAAGGLAAELARAGASDAAASAEDPKAAARARLEALTRREPVMLFMKGSPEAPQCGFSAKVVAALRAAGRPFGHFDILTDDTVRQGMKEYSAWPTYPQLYAGGELLGGCDIVLELAEAGELAAALDELLP